jgi:hypothetical protein
VTFYQRREDQEFQETLVPLEHQQAVRREDGRRMHGGWFEAKRPQLLAVDSGLQYVQRSHRFWRPVFPIRFQVRDFGSLSVSYWLLPLQTFIAA